MTIRSLSFALAGLVALAAPSPATAITINNGTVNCFDCTYAPSNGKADLQVGDRYAVSNDATFLDAHGDAFDVMIEVLALGAAPDRSGGTLSDGRVGYFSLKGLNRFVHLRVTTIADGAAEGLGAGDASPDAVMVDGLDRVSILDVDSNGGRDFTEVAGANLPVLAMGHRLEAGGFDNLPGAPNGGFSYVRNVEEPRGSKTDWRNVGNLRNDASQTVDYLMNGGVTSFEFVWGTTGSDRSSGPTRGWELEFSSSPAVVPLPAGAALALSGLGALGLFQWAKRRRPS